ncbi:MAG: hypothetical protein ABIF17_03620, partial [Patescibacteria group bacterium]
IDEEIQEIDADLGEKTNMTLERILTPEEISQQVDDIFFNEPSPNVYLDKLSKLIMHTSPYEKSSEAFLEKLNKISNQQEFEMIKLHQKNENVIYKPFNQVENDIHIPKKELETDIPGGGDFITINPENNIFAVGDTLGHDKSVFKTFLYNFIKKLTNSSETSDISIENLMKKFEIFWSQNEISQTIAKNKLSLSSAKNRSLSSLAICQKGKDMEGSFVKYVSFSDINMFSRDGDTGKVRHHQVKKDDKLSHLPVGLLKFIDIKEKREEILLKNIKSEKIYLKENDNIFLFTDGLTETFLSNESMLQKILEKIITEDSHKPGSLRNRLAQKIRLAKQTNFFSDFTEKNTHLNNTNFIHKLKETINTLPEKQDDISGVMI